MKKLTGLIILCLVLVSCTQATYTDGSQVGSNYTANGASTSLGINRTAAPVPVTDTPQAAPATLIPVTGADTDTPQADPATETPQPGASTEIPQAATATQMPASSAPAGNNVFPNFAHIILIMLENQPFSVINSPRMPLLEALADKNVLLSNYFAITHPSLPNYIALMSGSTQGITNDCIDCFVNQPNLADEIETSGRTWKAYLEDMPSPCFVGDSGKYAQKHNPLIYFDSIRLNTARCDRSIVPLTNLDSDLVNNSLPNFSFIMPNLCNSGHDCSAAVADTWVNDIVNMLQASPALVNNSLIIIAFDEGSDNDTSSCCGLPTPAGGQVAVVLISPTALTTMRRRSRRAWRPRPSQKIRCSSR